MAKFNRISTLALILILTIDWSLLIEGAAVQNFHANGYRSEEYLVAKCRQKCFLKTLSNFSFRRNINSVESIKTCQSQPDCYMCWDYCQVLVVANTDLANAMCSDQDFCSKGCQIACKSHRIKTAQIFTNHRMFNNS